MSLKMKVLPVAATLALAAGVVMVGPPPANGATPECGPNCISVFSRELGSYGDPNVVEAVLDGVAEVGQPVILAPASSSDPSQDFLPDARSVSDFYEDGLVSAEVNSHYGTLIAAQIRYAPFGSPSDLCVGLATTAFQGQGLTLQPCTVSARTVWIVDSPEYAPNFVTIVNGSTTDFSHPFAMTYPRDQQATDQRLQQILVRRLQFLSENHAVPDTQLWGTHFGALP